MYEFIDFVFSTRFLMYAGISLVPILGWLFIFQRIHPQKRSHVVITFIAGMLSVIPMKLYERFIQQGIWYFEHLNIFQHLGALIHTPEVPKILSYIISNAILSFIIFIFAALLMFILEVFISGDNTMQLFLKKFKKVLETPFLFLSIGVLVGVFSYVVTTGLQHFSFLLEYGLVHKVSFFIVVGMLEEYIKHLMVRFSDEEKIHSVDDAISFSIIVAFGFAFIENIMYFKNFADNFQNSWGFLATFLVLRSLISVGAHVCFSAICGYFYGIASFAKEITREELFQVRHQVMMKLQRVLHLKSSTLFHEEKIMEGLLLAMGLHAIFNILLQLNLLMVTIMYLFILFLVVLSRFHKLHYHRQENNLEEKPFPLKEPFDVLSITPLPKTPQE